ncbi:uncharacterized protein [Amphiura filiformis]|uniref:uncharacterized protein n=1 Tax=Amphiura filiformis TaxID=82378 RepID=UPI003B216578
MVSMPQRPSNCDGTTKDKAPSPQKLSSHQPRERGTEKGGASGIGFIIRKDLTANVLCYKSTSDRVALMIIQLSNQQKLRIIHIYMPTTSYKDDAVDKVYEEINGLLNQDKARHTIIMGDFNVKVATQRAREQLIVNLALTKLLDFAVNKGFRIMNTFFKKNTMSERYSKPWKQAEATKRQNSH